MAAVKKLLMLTRANVGLAPRSWLHGHRVVQWYVPAQEVDDDASTGRPRTWLRRLGYDSDRSHVYECVHS